MGCVVNFNLWYCSKVDRVHCIFFVFSWKRDLFPLKNWHALSLKGFQINQCWINWHWIQIQSKTFAPKSNYEISVRTQTRSEFKIICMKLSMSIIVLYVKLCFSLCWYFIGFIAEKHTHNLLARIKTNYGWLLWISQTVRLSARISCKVNQTSCR